MITRIKLNNLATYTQEVIIDDLKPINFCYGSNGSGKTTISKIIANEELYPNCEVEWQTSRKLKALVFNEDFIKKYFYQPSNLPGIFTMGEGAKDIEEKITEKNNEIGKINSNQTGLEETKERKENDLKDIENNFRKICWENIYQKYQQDFPEIFKGYGKSKEKFAERIIDENKKNTSALKTLADLKEKYNLLYNKQQIEKINELNIISISNNDIDQIEAIEKHQILKTKIIGKQDVNIAQMIHKLQNHDWVRKGKEYYDKNYNEESQSYICPFCQQKTTEEFKKQLESYFDENYEKQLAELKKIKDEYNKLTAKIIDYFSNIDEIKNNKYLEEKRSVINDKKEIIIKTIQENENLLQKKLDNPSIEIKLSTLLTSITGFNTEVEEMNKKINEHNLLITNKESEKKNLESEIWKFFCNEISANISNYEAQKKDIETALANIKNQLENNDTKIKSLQNEISGLEKQIKSVTPTVVAINKILQGFGFTNFKLEPNTDDKYYKIVRMDGSPAKETLSEGERNFIVFLYFYHLIQGVINPDENINEDKIVVFDDPVSSLDSDVLFIVSTLIRDIVEKVRKNQGNIKQVFLLTHNAYFFKEVSYINSRESQNNRKDTMYYVVRKKDGVSNIQKHESTPIKTTYQLLWDELKNGSSQSIYNTMRRIFEYYFKILAGINENELLEKFENKTEKKICKSLISLINVGSHEIFDDINFNPKADIGTYQKVFKDIFEKTGHINHYNMMMGNDG